MTSMARAIAAEPCNGKGPASVAGRLTRRRRQCRSRGCPLRAMPAASIWRNRDRGGSPCAFPDARRRCVTRLTRRGFFSGAVAAGFAATAVAPAAADAAPARRFTSVVDLTHTMSPDFPDLLRRAGDRDGKAIRFQEGRVQPLLVADRRARRHASRCADPLLRNRATADQIRPTRWWCRSRSSTSPPRRRRIPTTW